MAVLSKRDRAADRRRDAEASFLVATESLLAGGEPYADLSVERISAAAGRSRTAFYMYFRDKRELLMRATETVAAELYEEAERWWSGDDGQRGLRAALADVVDTYRKHAPLLRAVVEASAYDEEVGAFWRALVARFTDATERRLVEEGDEPGLAAAKAFALVWMFERSCYQQLMRGGDPADPALVDALTEIWERAIYPPR